MTSQTLVLTLLAPLAFAQVADPEPAAFPLDGAYTAIDKFSDAMNTSVDTALASGAVSQVVNVLFTALAISLFVWKFVGYGLRGFDMLWIIGAGAAVRAPGKDSDSPLLRLLAGREVVIFGDGAQTRDFTFVEDTARGLRLAARMDAAIGGTFNLGSGRETAIREVAAAVARALGLPPPAVRHTAPRPGDVRRLIADSTLAARVLGYAPRVSFEDGLRRLAAWYREGGIAPETLLESEVERNWEPAPARP